MMMEIMNGNFGVHVLGSVNNAFRGFNDKEYVGI